MNIRRINSAGLILFVSAMLVSGCGNKAPAEEKVSVKGGINIYTEILEFPDPDASKRSPASGRSKEKELFAEKAGKAYSDMIAAFGGNPPLEGPGRIKFSRDMMLIQAEILFDMKLGPNHPSKKNFLSAVGWCFDQRQPINEKRQKMLDKGIKFYKQAEEEFIIQNSKLQSDVKKKFKDIFGKQDYEKLTGDTF